MGGEEALVLGRRPRRRAQTTPAVACETDRGVRSIERPIPELARDLLVALVKPFAVVRKLAAPHPIAVPEADFPEPVGIGKGLAGGRHAIRLALFQNRLGLLEGGDAAARHDRRLPSGAADRAADRRGQRDVAAERAARVRDDRRHALVSRRTGVGIDGLTDLRLLRILETPTLRPRQMVAPCPAELPAEPDRVVQVAPALDPLVAEVANADDVVVADARADRRQRLQRQPHAVLARAAIAVAPNV